MERKIETLARKLYGADGVDFDRGARRDLELLNRHGFAELPICIAKTPMSLSDDPGLRGRPRGFRIKVNELRISAGAGLRGGDLRQHRHHAGPAQSARRRAHQGAALRPRHRADLSRKARRLSVWLGFSGPRI